jgi:predicted RND superfamily exporter protein
VSGEVPLGPLARARSFVAWTLRHARWLALATAVLVALATVRTGELYLHLRSELEELLPTSAASVVAIRELRARMPGMQVLGVLVDSGDADHLSAAERFLDDLAVRVRAYPPALVSEVSTGDAAERRFVEDHSAMYVSAEDLSAIRARIETRRDYDVAKASGALLDEDEPPPSLDFRDIQNRYHQSSRFPAGRYSSEDLHLSLLLIKLGAFDSGRSRGAELLARVRHDIEDLGGVGRYAPGMHVGFTGDVAIQVEETSALVTDLSLSGVVVALLVVAVILIYFRWWPSIVVLLVPLLAATTCAFALASLPPLSVTALNSNTAFLGSIIVGNGINFGIVLLARYVEARRSGCGLEEALAVAVAGARKGTLSAALAASASYASLALTQFRGFRQFGIVGGLGMVLSWGFAFVLMPPLIASIDRRGAWAPVSTRRLASPMAHLARAIAYAPRALLVGSFVLTCAALWKVHTLDASWIETDFSRLRRADTWERGEGYWGRRMEALLGTYLTPTVILTDDVDQARRVAAQIRRMRESPALAEQVASVRTIDDVLPPDQPAKVAEVDALRDDLTPAIRAAIPAAQLADLDRLLDPPAPGAFTAADLPSRLTAGLRERDGTLGREVLVFPRPSRSLWQGAPLETFVHALREASRTAAVDKGGRSARVAGSLPLSADILAAVRGDGPRASVAALVGVMMAVVLIVGTWRASALVIASLLVAVTWLVAATALAGVRVNFADFIAYPITFGIGADYAVNIVGRHAQRPGPDLGPVLRSTGGAVALCSLTTIIGYSSLLMAQNRGLLLFGVVAVLGEVCCISTALVAVPAFLTWSARRAARNKQVASDPSEAMSPSGAP